MATVIAGVIVSRGMGAEIIPVRRVESLHQYKAVIIGGDIRLGMLQADMSAFILNYQAELSRLPVAYFISYNTLNRPTQAKTMAVHKAAESFSRGVPGIQPVYVGEFAHQAKFFEFLFPGKGREGTELGSEKNISCSTEVIAWTENLVRELEGLL